MKDGADVNAAWPVIAVPPTMNHSIYEVSENFKAVGTVLIYLSPK
jgi:hypothetical protein